MGSWKYQMTKRMLDPLRTNSQSLHSLQGLLQTMQRIGINRIQRQCFDYHTSIPIGSLPVRSRQLFLTKVSSFSTILRLVSLFLFSFHNLIFISDNQLIKCERRIPNLPSIFILKIHILTSLESSDKNEGFERLEIPVFCSLLRIRPIVVRL